MRRSISWSSCLLLLVVSACGGGEDAPGAAVPMSGTAVVQTDIPIRAGEPNGPKMDRVVVTIRTTPGMAMRFGEDPIPVVANGEGLATKSIDWHRTVQPGVPKQNRFVVEVVTMDNRGRTTVAIDRPERLIPRYRRDGLECAASDCEITMVAIANFAPAIFGNKLPPGAVMSAYGKSATADANGNARLELTSTAALFTGVPLRPLLVIDDSGRDIDAIALRAQINVTFPSGARLAAELPISNAVARMAILQTLFEAPRGPILPNAGPGTALVTGRRVVGEPRGFEEVRYIGTTLSENEEASACGPYTDGSGASRTLARFVTVATPVLVERATGNIVVRGPTARATAARCPSSIYAQANAGNTELSASQSAQIARFLETVEPPQ